MYHNDKYNEIHLTKRYSRGAISQLRYKELTAVKITYIWVSLMHIQEAHDSKKYEGLKIWLILRCYNLNTFKIGKWLHNKVCHNGYKSLNTLKSHIKQALQLGLIIEINKNHYKVIPNDKVERNFKYSIGLPIRTFTFACIISNKIAGLKKAKISQKKRYQYYGLSYNTMGSITGYSFSGCRRLLADCKKHKLLKSNLKVNNTGIKLPIGIPWPGYLEELQQKPDSKGAYVKRVGNEYLVLNRLHSEIIPLVESKYFPQS